MKVQRTPFGRTNDGQSVDLITLTNSLGSQLQMTNYGAIMTKVIVPDREGRMQNVTLGFDKLDGYLQPHPFFGATVGRFCNRIAGGRFELGGKAYQLPINKAPNHIHGGPVGFDKRVWQEYVDDAKATEAGMLTIRFSLISPDGDQGYPGSVRVEADYCWSETNELGITFRATSDAHTIINMTNHAYWNLAGASRGSIADHILQLDCDQYLEVDETLIPVGTIADVAGTPLDFRQPHPIVQRLDQLPGTKGYDHCFLIAGEVGKLRRVARVQSPISGRTMEVWSTQPGVQFYTGNHLSVPYPAHSGFCLETQHYPDSPNQPQFPTTQLSPGETFEETTIYRFGVA